MGETKRTLLLFICLLAGCYTIQLPLIVLCVLKTGIIERKINTFVLFFFGNYLTYGKECIFIVAPFLKSIAINKGLLQNIFFYQIT